jgi:hypothetical protein
MNQTGRNCYLSVSDLTSLCTPLVADHDFIVPTLVAKLKAASKNSSTMSDFFKDLTKSTDKAHVLEWTQLEADAMKNHGEALWIFEIALLKRMASYNHAMTY